MSAKGVESVIAAHNALAALVSAYGAMLEQQAREHALVIAQLQLKIAELEAKLSAR